MSAPYSNCSFKICDLPGVCVGHGKCHHPDENFRLREQLKVAVVALEESRKDLEYANNHAQIADTIWHTETETLFDYMDAALAQIKDMEKLR